LTKTYRRRDIKPIKAKINDDGSNLLGFDIKTQQGYTRDGACWRGCGDKHCSFCTDNRQHKKIKEYIRANEIIHEELINDIT
jgi:hypothetical protein